jgi:basic membrane protein A
MRKSTLFILLALLLVSVVALSACGGSKATPTQAPAEEKPAAATEAPAQKPAEKPTEAPAAEKKEFKVGLVTDVGRINDRSFNQSAWEGVKMAAEKLGLSENDIKYIETKDAKDYADNINQFIENGYNVIISVGFALGDATHEAAVNNPDIMFIGVDQFQADPLPNYAGLIFPEDKAGYLAGVLAASLTKTGTIGAVLGTDLVPPVVAFKEGYEAGAKATKPDIKLISTYHPGELSQAFVDPEWGAATAKQAMDQGADVIFGAGGMTGNGALQEVAAAAESGKEVYCIGVDTDQWETLPAAHPCLVSSAMKLITPGVADLIEKAYNGDFPGGNYVGDVGLAPFHDFEDKVPQEVKDLLVETKKGLMDGSISTGYNPGGAPAEEEKPEAEAKTFTVGMVSDLGGIDDKSFNQTAWKGIEDAMKDLPVEGVFLESQQQTDYEKNINEFISQKKDLIITVGFMLGDATKKAAEANPDAKFAIVDYPSEAPNIRGLLFNVAEPSFLAGYLAAGVSETGVVCTYGGINIPPVVEFMAAFQNGVNYYNEKNGADVTLLGWDNEAQDGAFTGNFESTDDGRRFAENFFDEGCDVIFPVAGPVGLGSAAAAKDRGMMMIGVDTDQYISAPEFGSVLFTSVLKNMDKAVYDTIADLINGKFEGGENYLGTLANGGVGLAPYHDFEDKVSDELKADIESLIQDIIDGKVSVK